MGAAFKTAVDIGNRALQHCGSPRMDPTQGFAENSKAADEVSFAYDKLRVAELQTNVWTFAIRRTAIRPIDTSTMLINPALWVASSTYFVGSIVSDESGDLWISNIPNNIGNNPLLTTAWEPYFGPLSVSLYGTGNSYFSGELVYTTAGDGKNRVYLSLLDGNQDNPATATPYSATVTYFKNQVVTYLSIAYMSLIDLNTNNTPSAAPVLWSLATTYAIGNQAGGSDGVIYTSVTSGNIGNDPTLDVGTNWTNTGVLNPWTTVFVGGTGSDKWLQIGGTEFPVGVGLKTLGLIYPIGAGPSSQLASRNVFKLPAGYLREASQNPKGTTAWLGGPTGYQYTDWNLENGYLVTRTAEPIALRFVANITDVNRMTPMFCEALAARIALAIGDSITQSQSQVGMIAKIYQEWVDRARTRNAIEQGYVDPPDDDFLVVRY